MTAVDNLQSAPEPIDIALVIDEELICGENEGDNAAKPQDFDQQGFG